MIQNGSESFPLQSTKTFTGEESGAPGEEGYTPREEGYAPREGSVSAQTLSPGHEVDYVNPRGVRFTSHHRGGSM